MASSAAHSAFHCGRYISVSAGASVPGAIRNSICTPSMVRVSPVLVIRSVGGTSVSVPCATALPSPASTWPVAERCRLVPYMYWARRLIALPAKTFSLTASSMKPSGASTLTLPALTSSSLITPLAPPKWSAWLCV
ncbi:hypothetical protein D9M68_857850 [compost metagenome]